MHGLPDTIVSDNGAWFTLAEFQRFMAANVIHQITADPFHPSTDGQAERMVQMTKESLRRILHGDCPLRLAECLLQQHITPHTRTGRSPAELLMIRQLTSLLDRLHPDLTLYRPPRHEASETPRSFQVGDMVYAQNYNGGSAWILAKVTGIMEPVSYAVTTGEEKVLWWHVS